MKSLSSTGEECDDGNTLSGDGCSATCFIEVILAEVGDRVWLDTDRNGVQDAFEVGVGGVQVMLYNATGTLAGMALTDTLGNFLFTGLQPGNYYLHFVPPAGLFVTIRDATGDVADSDADPVTGLTSIFTLNSGDSNLTLDAGLHQCGNGQVQPGEQCDDGNTNNFDSCRNDCSLPSCGDGVVDAGEECDDGNVFDLDACRGDCTLPFCGDGIVDAGEGCDDNNNTAGDGCDASCQIEVISGQPADLSIAKIDMPDPATPGLPMAYILIVSNAGPGAALGVNVTELLDTSTTYQFVTGDGTCTEVAPSLLSCDLGDMAAGSSKSLTITVDVDATAPTEGVLQNGACDGTEDLCNLALVSAATTDPDQTNNSAEEPTDVLDTGGAGSGTCGNFVVEPGEQCDPPNPEDCGNGLDDDGDGLVDCDDPNCPTGVQPATTCGLSCQVVPACQPFQNDPAEIKFGKKGKPDKFKIHARFNPLTAVDIYNEEFSFTLSNERGAIWHAKLYPGDLVGNKKGTSFKFSDKLAKRGGGTRGGISKLKVKYKLWAGTVTWPFTMQAYGDFSLATLPRMTSEIRLGDDIGYLSARWSGQYGKRWRITLSEFLAQQK